MGSTSLALRRLRACVTVCAAVVCLSAVGQALVYAFVDLTDVRWTTLVVRDEKGLKVVGNEPVRPSPVARDGGKDGAVRESVIDANHVTTAMDATLRNASAVCVAAGCAACVTLVICALLGAVLMCGAALSGVDRVVAAALWSVGLAVLMLPWGVGSGAIGPVFLGYSDMTGAHAPGHGAGPGAFAARVLLPLATAGVVVLVGAWFRSGVHGSILNERLSREEQEIDNEMTQVSRRGAAGALPRSAGALMAAIPVEPAPHFPLQPQGGEEAPVRRVTKGDGLRRPI